MQPSPSPTAVASPPPRFSADLPTVSKISERHLHEEQELQSRTRGERLFQLDSLRGIAAVCVVLHHLRFVKNYSPPPWYLQPFFSGTQAVILFFVLSGYVLSLPYWSGKKRPYKPYIIRRFCRIYLPFAAAAVISILGASIFYKTRLPLTGWIHQTWQTPITFKLLVAQFLMWDMADFNTAFWSLRYEMQMSFVMPFLCMLLRKPYATAVMGILGLWVYWHETLVMTIHWHFVGRLIPIVFLFVLGASLAKYRDRLRKVWTGMGSFQWIVLAISVLGYVGFLTRLAIHLHFPRVAARDTLLCGMGAAGIVLCALYLQPFAKILTHTFPEYLGRISYSLYLVHGTVIFTLLHVFYGHIRLNLLLIIAFILSFVVAHLFCIAIEEPTMRVGKWLTAKKAVRPELAETAR